MAEANAAPADRHAETWLRGSVQRQAARLHGLQQRRDLAVVLLPALALPMHRRHSRLACASRQHLANLGGRGLCRQDTVSSTLPCSIP